MRKMGLRSRSEINCEIYALKVLRGDFAAVGARDVGLEETFTAVGL